ncbi:MAG: hypothetical protein ABSF83_01590 [Nitrososphaerales archaeon]
MKVGLTYDTRDDFRFVSEEPEDWDAEFEVSTAIDDIAHAIEDLGHRAVFVGSGRKLLDNFRDVERSVDIVFNIAEGYFGRAREAQIPAMLELAGVPYVGSDSYALALAASKWHTKVLAASYGIRTPAFHVIHNMDELDDLTPDYPVICKLCYEGSSKGLRTDSVANDKPEMARIVNYLLKNYKQPVIVEKFIEGREVDVPIIGNSPSRAFGVVGLTLNGSLELGERFLTSDIVRADGYGFRYPLEERYVKETELSAVKIYNLLECRDFGRVDLRISEEGLPYLLEVNPYPFLGKHSSFNEIAKSTIGYDKMIGSILESALLRQMLRKSH